MKEFQSLDMPGPKNVLLWDRMRYGYISSKVKEYVKQVKNPLSKMKISNALFVPSSETGFAWRKVCVLPKTQRNFASIL